MLFKNRVVCEGLLDDIHIGCGSFDFEHEKRGRDKRVLYFWVAVTCTVARTNVRSEISLQVM
jgi:hypothetical protein